MSDLPRGTVTFLFTDIEGSTRLLQHLGRDRYDEVLGVHRDVLEAAFAAHEGRVVDTQGDSFFVAFRTAADAVAAAVDAQRELAAQSWPEAAAVRVRMGLHTGEPKVGAERYVGVGVHKAARIGAAGHGGQVLLSSTTKELAGEELPTDISIRDLGERRLKDLEQPERIFQLEIAGLQSEFAQLRTLDVELARKRRRMYAGSALIGVAAAAVAIPVFALGAGSSGGGEVVSGNSVAIIDPGSDRVIGQVAVGAQPGAIAYGPGGLWVSNLDDQTVSHVDPKSDRAVRAIPMGEPVEAIAVGRRSVWALSVVPNQSFARLRQIDPRFDTIAKTTRVQAGALLGGGGLGNDAAVAVGGDTVWAGTDSGLLERLDLSGKIKTSLDTGNSPVAIAVGAGGVWVADPYSDNVARIDPATDLVSAPIPVGNGPGAIAVGANAVWVANSLDDAVVRIDPNTNAVTNTVDVGRSPSGLAFGDGAVWVANSGDGTVSRIDPHTYAVTTIPVGGSPQAIAVGGGRVWVTVQPAAAASGTARPGGDLRVDSELPYDYLDTALSDFNGSWEVEYATCAKLLNYPDRPAPAGARLVPEVAAAVPKPTHGGKTYTFTIRGGFRFSPPSNEPVTAKTFKFTIERTLDPRLKSPAIGYASDIVGVKAYEAGKAQSISGVTARGDKLTIRLTAPAPDFLTRIALPFFCAVPPGTPVNTQGVRVIPSAGPYYLVSYSPKQGAVLKRNPSYHGPRPHRLAEIDINLDVGQAQTVTAIQSGRADFAAGGVPQEAAPSLARRYGPGSAAAKAGHQRFFVNPQPYLIYLAMNTSRPLFARARIRRAVNYALDRRTLGRIGGYGVNTGTPTDQLLPPGIPGYRPVHAYPFTPNLAKARQLARGEGGHGVLYACADAQCRQAAQVVQADLKAIGVDLEIKTFGLGDLFSRIGTLGEPYDAAITNWYADYPDPSDFFNLFYGPAIVPNTNNISRFDDPAWNSRIAADARLTGPKRYLAYTALDASLTREDPPYAALFNGSEQDFFSARVGCVTYQPVYGIDLAALCIRKG